MHPLAFSPQDGQRRVTSAGNVIFKTVDRGRH